MIEVYERVIQNPAWKKMRNMNINPRDAVLPDGTIMAGNVVRRNIFYYQDPAASLFKERNFSFDHNVSDDNLVWNGGNTPRTGQSHIKGVSGPNLAPNPGFEDERPGTTAGRLALAGTSNGQERRGCLDRAGCVRKAVAAHRGGRGTQRQGTTSPSRHRQ